MSHLKRIRHTRSVWVVAIVWTMLMANALSTNTLTNSNCFAANNFSNNADTKPTEKIVYKTVGDVELKLHVFKPAQWKATDSRPAIVFFFGGGWTGGNPKQFYPHAAHLAELGFVAFSAEYRVKSRNNTTPFECVKDGKSAIRYVRAHAQQLGVDPNRIASGGGSAGGHVAAATGTVPGLNESTDDLKVSAVPNAMVLFNPVYDNSKKGYGYNRVKDRYLEISPMHNIQKGIPPAVVFLGTKDALIPVETAKEFQQKMKDVGSKSELMLFEGAAHGFFNHGREGNVNYLKTIKRMDQFLTDVGFLGS